MRHLAMTYLPLARSLTRTLALHYLASIPLMVAQAKFALALRDFGSAVACFAQTNRNGLLAIGYFVAAPTLELSFFELMHGFFDFLLGFGTILCHVRVLLLPFEHSAYNVKVL